MPTVYVVMGTTGEYSGSSEWGVCAYLERAKADAHADAAKLWDHNHGAAAYERYRQARRKEDAPRSPWDESYQRSYTGTDYFVLEVNLREALPVVENGGS